MLQAVGTYFCHNSALAKAMLSFLLWSAIGLTLRAEVSFRNDVMPVISKSGCNAGACHGNANGKAGFKLSLRGESPNSDYHALTHDQFGRRTDAFDPGQSLILLKATAQIAHEGGQRFRKDSEEFKLLVQWIKEGLKNDTDTAVQLTHLEATPSTLYLFDPATSAQIQVTATFSDGVKKDVTRWAVYESANGLAKISPSGLAEKNGFGETTILVRFLEKQAPVRLAFVPPRPDFKWNKPVENTYIDRFIFSKLKALKINPSEVASDGVFIRRAYLDLLGSLPPPQAAQMFVKAKGANKKRALLINDLLARSEFADFWALKWSDLLRNEERLLDRKGVERFHGWVRQSIAENKPLDVFARELISARGSTYENPAANYYRANRDPISRAEAAAQVFLGTRLQCAQCHNHPFDQWTQNDYYDWASVFSRVQYKVIENRRRDSNDGHEFKGEQIIYLGGKSEIKNPRTGKTARARFLGMDQVFTGNESVDELKALSNWLVSTNNQRFAQVQVNRIWFHLMGRGIVDPVDDFRATNPASHPELLEAMTKDFIAHGYDLVI